MSNPYGGGYQPYEPQQSPYGVPSYNAPNPYGVGAAAPSTDGISIAAFVCSLTCCAAPVGIGLGIAGLVRTKGGKRSGRWAAIAGLVIGIIASISLVGALVGLVWFGNSLVLEDEARVGQCVETRTAFDSVDLYKAECGEPHDAEVIWVEQFDDTLVHDFGETSVVEFCRSRNLDPTYESVVEDDVYEIGYASDAFDDQEPRSGDWFVCFVERSDEEKLTGPLG